MSRHRNILRAAAPLVTGLVVGTTGLLAGVALAYAAGTVLDAAGVPVFDDLALAIGVTVVMQGTGFAVTAAAYLRYRNLGLPYIRLHAPDRWDGGWIVVGLAVLLIALLGIDFLFQTLGIDTPAEHEIVHIVRQHPQILPFLAVLSVIVIGPGEELLFRGVIQTRLIEAYGPAAGIAVTSLIFATAHIPAYGAGDVAVIVMVLFVLSLVIGTLYEITDTLVVPAAVHGLYNATLFLALYASIRYNLPVPPGL